MIKIDLPKQGWIASASQEFLKDGFWKGAFAIHLSMTGAICESQDVMLDVLERLISVPSPKRKIVRLSGMLHPTDPTMQTFIRSLKDYGFSVQAVLKNLSYQWMQDLNWSIYLTESPFIPYQTNEVWYKPPVSDKIIEPKTLPQETSGIPVFLYLFPGYSVAASQEFVLNAKFNWSLM